MNDKLILMLCMALRQIPARVKVEQASALLGFTDDDFTILMSVQKLKLKPLGNPAQNAPKLFATAQLLELAADPDWLHDASSEIKKHHLKKRSRLEVTKRGPSGGGSAAGSGPEVFTRAGATN